MNQYCNKPLSIDLRRVCALIVAALTLISGICAQHTAAAASPSQSDNGNCDQEVHYKFYRTYLSGPFKDPISPEKLSSERDLISLNFNEWFRIFDTALRENLCSKIPEIAEVSFHILGTASGEQSLSTLAQDFMPRYLAVKKARNTYEIEIFWNPRVIFQDYHSFRGVKIERKNNVRPIQNITWQLNIRAKENEYSLRNSEKEIFAPELPMELKSIIELAPYYSRAGLNPGRLINILLKSMNQTYAEIMIEDIRQQLMRIRHHRDAPIKLDDIEIKPRQNPHLDYFIFKHLGGAFSAHCPTNRNSETC